MSTREERAQRRAESRSKLLEKQLNLSIALKAEKNKKQQHVEEEELPPPTYKEIFGESEPETEEDLPPPLEPVS